MTCCAKFEDHVYTWIYTSASSTLVKHATQYTVTENTDAVCMPQHAVADQHTANNAAAFVVLWP